MTEYDERVIAEFRSHGGTVQGFGDGLVLVHSTGARTGEARVNPLAAIPDGGSWLVIASAGGSPKHPGWYFNLVEHPDAVVETGSGSVDVHAAELEGAEYDAALERFIARSTSFASYQEKAGRHIPILRLEPRG